MESELLEASRDIDRLPATEIVRIIQAEDAKVAASVAVAAEAIAQAIDGIVERLRAGGRMFYAGAGTSGRIAQLDAAELGPTFGVPNDLVQVLLAGGPEALVRPVEGAEDDEEAATLEIRRHDLGEKDALIGIAASGHTPYTVRAIREAGHRGSLTVGVTSVPGSALENAARIAIVTPTGPEVILGSSRMKSGTAQKMVLNALSTGVMIRLGRVHGNLMVDMPASNQKLRKRARRMVELAANTDPDTAARALESSGGNIREAIVAVHKGIDANEARRLLQLHGGRLREVLDP